MEHTRSQHPGTAWMQDWVTPCWRRVSGGRHPNRSTLGTITNNGFVITRLWQSKSGTMVPGEARKM